MKTVLLQRDGEIGWLKLNRAEALNAFNQEMADEMLARIDEIDADRELRVAILVGEGPSFSTGVDLKALGARGLGVGWFKDWQRVISGLEQLKIPLVIAANGHCLGGGLMLLLTSDYRIASSDLVTGLSAVKHGIIPGSAVYRLASAIGTLSARRLCLFTEYIDANEALRLGLIDKIVPRDQLRETALATARRVVGFSRVALKETKQLLARAASLDLAGFERAYVAAQRRCLESGDVKPWDKTMEHGR